MYPLWKQVIAPVLEAAGARRVVEIGALQGDTTMRLLEGLGPDAEVHVIDPVPQFDPSEHERRFPGRYHFHRAISHDVLPSLPPVDAALIDGDHNWYTVFHELRMLAGTAREAGAPLPVMVMHDVGWPYGRRDLYYAPERIPEEFRQPYAQKGIRPRRRPEKGDTLLDRGGFNQTMNNALEQGGPRNGVMTALDDFVAEHDAPLRVFVLPLYYGLAVVAEEQRLREQPQLAAAFERFGSPEFLRDMLELAETLRIREAHWGQVVFYQWQDRLQKGARRYLDLLKRDLGATASLDALEECLATIRTDKVDGDFVHCGAADPDVPVFLRAFAAAHDLGKVKVWVAGADGDARRGLERAELLDDGVRFADTGLDDGGPERIALLRLARDADATALERLYGRVALGGYVVADGLDDAHRRAAVERFLADHGVEDEQVMGGGAEVRWRKVRSAA